MLCAQLTSQLVTCVKIVSPTITSPECQEQVVEATKQVARSVDDVVGAAHDCCTDELLLRDVADQAGLLTRALDDLRLHVHRGVTYADVVGVS